MLRQLDYLETLCQGYQIVYVVEYRGKVYGEALKRAYNDLCIRHPILRAKIYERNGGYILEAATAEPSHLFVKSGGWREVLHEVDAPWDVTVGVARLGLIEKNNHGFVVLQVDHAVADGRAGVALLEELWVVYTTIVSGAEARPKSPGSLPPPPYERLRAQLVECPYPGASNSLPRHNGDATNQSSPLRRRIRLERAETERLIVAARRHGTSVHALLSGAILVVQRDYGAHSMEQTRMVCWSAADLRSRMKPPMGPTEATVFVGTHRSEILLEKNANPVTVGLDVKAQMDTCISQGRILIAPLASGVPSISDTLVEQRLANAFLSNKGIIRELRTPDELTVNDVRIFQTGPAIMPYYGFSTYGRRMNIEFYYPSHCYFHNEVDALAKDVVDSIRSIGRRAAH